MRQFCRITPNHTDHLSSGPPTWLDTVCHSCRARLSRPRHASTTATATASPELQHFVPPQQTSTHPPTPSPASGPITTYAVRTGVVLSRAPLLTRDLTTFEKAYYLYQRRLNERLTLPFTRYFYYKKGTPADDEWKRKARARRSAARDIGDYSAYGSESWADEVLVGDKTGDLETQVQAIVNDAEGKTLDGKALPELLRRGEDAADAKRRKENSEALVIDKPNPRRTVADQAGDRTSLDRLLERTVYLLVRNQEGRWRFPEDVIRGREGLHDVSSEM